MTTSLSYVSNPTKVPYMYESITDRIRCLSTEEPEREAFVFYDVNGERKSVTRRALYQTSTLLAKHFIHFGMRKGSWVGLCMNNSLNMLYVVFGVSFAGGIPFFLATNLKDGSDVIEQMNDMKGEYLMIDAEVSDPNWNILETIWGTNKQSSECVPALKHVVCNGNRFTASNCRVHLSALLSTPAPENIQLPTIFPEDILLCFCTSGSTGKPKAVVWSHYAILNWGQNCEASLCFSNETIYFCERPFAWAGGFPRLYLTVGCTHVFVDTRLSLSGKCLDQLCNIIENEKVEVAYIPRYIAKDLRRNPQYASKFRNLSFIITGGERFATALLSLKDEFCRTLISWYGNTETGGSVRFFSSKSEEYEEGIIGVPVPGVEVKIVNEKDDVVPVGECGELCIRCTWRFISYKTMPETYNKVVNAVGWFHTGDIAHIRSDGNIVIDGRKQELITMQTIKYFPWEIEKPLRKCPGIKEAIAVGVPDFRLNQVICACAVPETNVSLTEEKLKQFCDDTFLEESTATRISLKPKYHLIFDDFPLTSSGKLDRRRLGIMAKERLGL